MDDGVGIRAATGGYLSPITIINSGEITAESANFNAFGINAATLGPRSPIAIENTGDIAGVGGYTRYRHQRHSQLLLCADQNQKQRRPDGRWEATG